MGIDSENHLFRILHKVFTDRIERTINNGRRRKLMAITNEVQMKLFQTFNEFEACLVVDSMPLEVCKIYRSARSKICKESDFSFPNKGFCASRQMPFYGYKLHAVCSVNGVLQSVDLCPASVHDIHCLEDIEHQIFNCILIGDKGYLSQ